MNIKIKNIAIISGLIFAAFLAASCDDTLTNNDIDSRPMPEKNISWSQDLLPVFQYKCAVSGCHNYESRAGDLNLLDWSDTYRVPIVIPHDAENSLIVMSVEGRGGLAIMPPVGKTYPMTSEQIRGLRTWIDEGAQNN